MPDVDAAKPRTESLVRNYTTRHARIDAEGQEVVVVGACCKFFVKAPWAIALITGLSTVVLSGVGLMPMEGLVPKNTGWTNRESVVQQSWASFEVLRDSRYDGEQPPPPPPAAQRRQLRWGSTPLDGRRLWEPQLANAEERRGPLLYQDPTPSLSLFREWQLSEYKFVYDTFGAGILQPDVVSSMIALERAVLDFPAWQSYCKLEYSNGYDCDSAADAGACGVAALPRKSACATPQSLLSYLHTNDAKHEAECRQGFCHTFGQPVEDPTTYGTFIDLCAATSAATMIAFPTWQTFQSGISDAMSAGASAKAISAAAGETVELQLAALAAAASAVVPSDVAADGTGITYRGFGKFPCVSTVFDWRDGTLAPEAQWPQLIDDEMCTTSTKAVANVILSERRNTNDTDMACDGSSLYARSRFLVGYPLYEDLTSGDVADDWGETAQRFEDEDDFRWDMAAHIDVEVTKYSATPAKARAAATGPSGDKQLNIFWVATLGGNTFALFMADFVYSLFSILFIFVYLWFNVGSLVLALAGLFEIICSFPLALFFWRKIMGQNNIDFLTFVGVFLILCVGADDIFVFMDTWKASRTAPHSISGSMETRFAWTWKRAAGTMLTTTLTTAISLICTAASPVPAVRAFGVFGALLIVADYVLVITWFPSVVLLHAKACGGCESCEAKCCCRAPKEQSCCEGGCGPNTKYDNEPPEERAITRFLRDKVAPFLNKAKFVLVFISLAIFAGSILGYVLGFEKASKIPLFKASHPLEQVLHMEAYAFKSSGIEHLRVHLQYGVDVTQPFEFQKNSQILPDAYGLDNDDDRARYVPLDFEPDVQLAIVAHCEAAHAIAGTFPDKLVDTSSGPEGYALRGCYCLLNEIKQWVADGASATAAAQPSFPFASEAALLDVVKAFINEHGVWNHSSQETVQSHYNYLRSEESGLNGYTWRTGFVLNDVGDDIIGYYATFNSSIPPAAVEGQIFGGDVNILKPAFDKWARFQQEHCVGSAAPCVFASDVFNFMDLLTSLADFALSTVLICLAASFVVLTFVTANVLVALITTTCVTIVIFSTIGLIILAGFKNGMYESIFTILVVGMAIDYAVHLAHYYNEAQGTRYQKAQAAIHGVGVSVLGGAVTTMGAGIPLFATVVIFFWTLANYIFFVAMSAIIMSFIFLIPVFMICGPQGEQGDLRVLFRMCGLGKENEPAAAAAADSEASAKAAEEAATLATQAEAARLKAEAAANKLDGTNEVHQSV